jgi:hypothetical protein
MTYLVQIVESPAAKTPDADARPSTYPLVARFSTVQEAEAAGQREIARLASAGVAAAFKIVDLEGRPVGPPARD